jgi:hypothetical protein
MMFGAPHPVWFFLGGVILLVGVLFAVVRAVLAELHDLPAPDRVPLRDGLASSRRVRGASSRGGQPDRLAAAQERAARDALRCAGGRVDVAPVRCPIEDRS